MGIPENDASKNWLKKNDVWYTVWWKNNAVKKFLWIVSSLGKDIFKEMSM